MSTITVRQRFDSPCAVPDEITIERGTLGDYRKLAAFHYRSHHAGAVMQVFRAVVNQPSAMSRFRSESSATQVVGVLVVSLPALACRLRDVATGGRYRGLEPRHAAAMLNREMRTISRVVVRPEYRGLGLAVRLVKHALAHAETPLTEALAVMGRVHPFFEKAGMTRYERPEREDHVRLLEALARVKLPATHLASTTTALAHIAALDERAQRFIDGELLRWQRSAGRRSIASAARFDRETAIRTAAAELASEPVYFIARTNQRVNRGKV